jgi:hypothetical protein
MAEPFQDNGGALRERALLHQAIVQERVGLPRRR